MMVNCTAVAWRENRLSVPIFIPATAANFAMKGFEQAKSESFMSDHSHAKDFNEI